MHGFHSSSNYSHFFRTRAHSKYAREARRCHALTQPLVSGSRRETFAPFAPSLRPWRWHNGLITRLITSTWSSILQWRGYGMRSCRGSGTDQWPGAPELRRGVKLQTPHMRWRNCDDEIDIARRERFIVFCWSCRSCGEAWSSRHRNSAVAEADSRRKMSNPTFCTMIGLEQWRIFIND